MVNLLDLMGTIFYIALIILVIVLIILVIRAIITLDKVDKTLDDIQEKSSKLGTRKYFTPSRAPGRVME